MFFNVEGANKKSEIKQQYDVVIIGGGPAGISAAIYALQGGASTLVIEKAIEGGQMNLTDIIENYPGFKTIKGEELSSLMKEHAEQFGADFYDGKVIELKDEDSHKTVVMENGKTIKSKAIIIASGSYPRKLGVKGEEEFSSRGVSYCASCDGHFFKNKKIAVVGGGNTAVEEAVYLSNIAKEVYIIHRREKLRADKLYQDRAFSRNNIKFKWNSVIEEIKGKDKVESLVIKNLKNDEVYEEPFDGVFVFVGLVPETSFLNKDLFDFDEYGFLITDENMETKVKGIYAVGDVRKKELRQIVTAVSDGAIAASHAIREYVNEDQISSTQSINLTK
ncbi:thioredoxin reductase [Petrotoga sp. 9T1HF07.CasAA.8.2]|uniref:thioredoxin-disulfide reductase n=1 Tax=unclassified Petrotoga TaxID=2620614 RepID=UPI000CBF1120|nr:MULTISPECIES: thioredoxin-disulfide reductase [unclassified Petrotoga]MBL5981850.1 thioredoxin reductase [Petrotoga sp. 8T1HF07.NaAc.6.1]PNR87369.1 thioredoxin reductase [Petrotoga sp. 9T1HF07.CasAA.8.2]